MLPNRTDLCRSDARRPAAALLSLLAIALVACDAAGDARPAGPAQRDAAIAGKADLPSRSEGATLMTLRGTEDDPRVRGIPRSGENAVSERDIVAMRSAAAMLLATNECSEVAYAGTSHIDRGIIYVNCGGYENRFFRMGVGSERPVFCGTSASACRRDPL